MALTVGNEPDAAEAEAAEVAEDKPVTLTSNTSKETDKQEDSDPGLVLFELDGVKYYVPRKPGPNVSLAYLRDVREHGEEYAKAGLLERFIGRAGMSALADYDDLEEEDLERIMGLVERHVLGPLQAQAGKKGRKGAPGKR